VGPLVVVLAILAIFFFIFAASAIRIVQPYQRGVKERLGKYHETLDPGLRVIVPFVDKIRMVDMREQVVDVPPQEVITSDNVVVSVDAVVYYEPTDPQRLVYNVANFILAVTKLAQTNLRNVIGDLQLDQALTSRDKINVDLRQILDDATDKWGVRVVRVEIQRIDPPPDVMHSMHEQMKAERTRRAVVTEADGRREASITTAEGEKQAAILRAEGERQRQILQAKVTPRPLERWPMPNASASSPWPKVRPAPSPPSTRQSMPVTPHLTCWPSSTSKPWGVSPTGRPPRSTCPPISAAVWDRWPQWPSFSLAAAQTRRAARPGPPQLALPLTVKRPKRQQRSRPTPPPLHPSPPLLPRRLRLNRRPPDPHHQLRLLGPPLPPARLQASEPGSMSSCVSSSDSRTSMLATQSRTRLGDHGQSSATHP
jgi:regulator of protease activity HflC (stomatin/prohibitin superfamily)